MRAPGWEEYTGAEAEVLCKIRMCRSKICRTAGHSGGFVAKTADFLIEFAVDVIPFIGVVNGNADSAHVEIAIEDGDRQLHQRIVIGGPSSIADEGQIQVRIGAEKLQEFPTGGEVVWIVSGSQRGLWNDVKCEPLACAIANALNGGP